MIIDTGHGTATIERTSAPTIGFVIADDHPVVSFALRAMIESRPGWRVAAHAPSPTAARLAVEQHSPRVLILDLLFPGESGVELLEWLRIKHPETIAIVYTAQPETVYASACIRTGARGFVCKCSPPEALIDTIATALDGRLAVNGRCVPQKPIRRIERRDAGDPILRLSLRELEVLELMGDGLNTRRIAERLCRSHKTIETHRARIARKLGVADSQSLLLVAIRHREATGAIRSASAEPAIAPAPGSNQSSGGNAC